MSKSQKSVEDRISEKNLKYEQAMEKAKLYQAQVKRLIQQQKAEERKKRNHILCQIGGVVEKVLERPLTKEDVFRLLNFLNQQERSGNYFTRAMEKPAEAKKELESTGGESLEYVSTGDIKHS